MPEKLAEKETLLEQRNHDMEKMQVRLFEVYVYKRMDGLEQVTDFFFFGCHTMHTRGNYNSLIQDKCPGKTRFVQPFSCSSDTIYNRKKYSKCLQIQCCTRSTTICYLALPYL